ncbi:MAG: MgtC/SapB family protein [Gemmatimonadetes bacterium]|nr:MgtC/SapB family protein [Gemmatimonadota bacterium]
MEWNANAIALIVSALCGGAVGLERQRSGHAVGGTHDGQGGEHFAGLRTFTLLGTLAGVTGVLWRDGFALPAAVLLGGAALLIAAAYVGASRRDVDGTTEVAALVVLAAGFLVGVGKAALGSAISAATVLLLMEKTRLHGWVERVDDREFRSGVRFAVMAAVVLPLLPAGPFGPGVGIRPRELWLVVLLITGLEFAGYVARRRVGNRNGYTLAGLLGGLISSTSVTLSYARVARAQPAIASALASGAIAANAAVFPRVALTALVLNPGLGTRVAMRLALPFVLILLALWFTLHRTPAAEGDEHEGRNPMHVGPALQLAAIYQVAMYAIHAASHYFGAAGLYVIGFFLGMTDIDALTISAARQDGTMNGAAASSLPTVVVVGVLGTTLFKLGVAATLGRGAFRQRVTLALGLVVAALVAALVVVP